MINFMLLTGLQAGVEELIGSWEAAAAFYMPDERDCLDFLLTEVGEAIDARLRVDDTYVRNNAARRSWGDVDNEVADALFMCLVWFILRDVDAGQVLRDKLQQMDRKRRGRKKKEASQASGV